MTFEYLIVCVKVCQIFKIWNTWCYFIS